MNTFKLTAIFHEDEKQRGITAHFAEFPNVIAVGKTESEATENLLELLQISLKYQKETAPLKRNRRIRSKKLSFRISGL